MSRHVNRSIGNRRLQLWPLVGALALVVSVGVWRAFAVSDETETTKDSSTGASTSEVDERKLNVQLDEVLASQEQVLQRFDGILEELRIIKVRSSSRSAPQSCP